MANKNNGRNTATTTTSATTAANVANVADTPTAPETATTATETAQNMGVLNATPSRTAHDVASMLNKVHFANVDADTFGALDTLLCAVVGRLDEARMTATAQYDALSGKGKGKKQSDYAHDALTAQQKAVGDYVATHDLSQPETLAALASMQAELGALREAYERALTSETTSADVCPLNDALVRSALLRQAKARLMDALKCVRNLAVPSACKLRTISGVENPYYIAPTEGETETAEQTEKQ